ncbi:hypothetical protein [Streptomyces sp. NPDC090083]|uniref:hypothetical protein n=1 Tax=Streptomyces sp. NPDC090083 TaxID=3365941 RepID=UPI00382AE9E3
MGGLIGRDAEREQLRLLLGSHRLVTVTGAAGMGKSALAAEAAGQLPGRVVGLRPSRKPVGATAADRDALHEACADASTSGTLVFLDGADTARRECVRRVQAALSQVPHLRFLVTSRRPLGLGEEYVVRLGPLADATEQGSGRTASVELFHALAQAVTGRPVPEDEHPTVSLVCRELEGRPLALELAAAQLREISLYELGERLAQGQCWLSGPTSGHPGHRSLRAAFTQDFVASPAAARAVWARASILSGFFTADDAVLVCTGGGITAQAVPALLADLALQHVLETQSDPLLLHPPRYRMTRAVREYGLQQLRETGELDIATERRWSQARHLVTTSARLWDYGDQHEAVRIVLEHGESLTEALEHAMSHPDTAQDALAGVVALWFWWTEHEKLETGLAYLNHLLAGRAPDRTTARALWLAAWLSAAADPEQAQRFLTMAWPEAVRAGDDALIGRIAHVQGVIALHCNAPQTAARHFQDAADLIPPHAPGGPSHLVSAAEMALAQTRYSLQTAHRTTRRLLAQPDICGDAHALSLARLARALVDRHSGRPQRARRRAHRALTDISRNLPTPRVEGELHRLIEDIDNGHPQPPGRQSPQARLLQLMTSTVTRGPR